jgi:hypothetical protein
LRRATRPAFQTKLKKKKKKKKKKKEKKRKEKKKNRVEDLICGVAERAIPSGRTRVPRIRSLPTCKKTHKLIKKTENKTKLIN